MSDDIAEIKRRLVWAMNLSEPTDDWVEEAERRLYAHENMRSKRKIYDVDTLGARIRTAREVLGITQHQLAARLRLRPFTISAGERGARDLPAEKLLALCASLAVKKAWLLGESTEGGPAIPERVMRKQFIPGWREQNATKKRKHWYRCELERLRGLRPPKPVSSEQEG